MFSISFSDGSTKWKNALIDALRKDSERNNLFESEWLDEYDGIKQDTLDPPHFRHTLNEGLFYDWSKEYDKHTMAINEMMKK